MVMKFMGKAWKCNNQCESNCCSEIFLPVNKGMMKSIDEERYFIVDNNYTDFKWVSYRNSLEIKKLDYKRRMITVLTNEYEFKFHDLLGMHMLYIPDKCNKLLPDGRCKVYRNRPMICKVAECPAFTSNPDIYWYAKNGKLKVARERYEKGEIEP